MIGDLIKNMIGPIISPLIERIPDPNERARAKEELKAFATAKLKARMSRLLKNFRRRKRKAWAGQAPGDAPPGRAGWHRRVSRALDVVN